MKINSLLLPLKTISYHNQLRHFGAPVNIIVLKLSKYRLANMWMGDIAQAAEFSFLNSDEAIAQQYLLDIPNCE